MPWQAKSSIPGPISSFNNWSLTKALPKMRDAASNAKLATVIADHLRETEQHVERLEGIFEMLGRKPHRHTCKAMKALIEEGEELMEAKGDDAIKDAALIAAAQRVEHYEIACYGTLCTLADKIDQPDVVEELHATLEEEKQADKKLTEVAMHQVNPPQKKAG